VLVENTTESGPPRPGAETLAWALPSAGTGASSEMTDPPAPPARAAGCGPALARQSRSDAAASPRVGLDRFAVRHRVVYDGKISWPTRGPNVDWTIGSTMRHRAGWYGKRPAKDVVQRSTSPSVVVPDSACHAGGRGFESRRSRLSKCLQISRTRCLVRREISLRGPNPWSKRPIQNACNSAISQRSCIRLHKVSGSRD
jgi:hypothetical protein